MMNPDLAVAVMSDGRTARDHVLGNRRAADQMLLQDPFDHCWGTAAVPNALWLHDQDWTSFTDPEAAGWHSQHAPLLGQSQFLEASFEILPRFPHLFFAGTFGGLLIQADQDHSVGLVQAQLFAAFPGRSEIGVAQLRVPVNRLK